MILFLATLLSISCSAAEIELKINQNPRAIGEIKALFEVAGATVTRADCAPGCVIFYRGAIDASGILSRYVYVDPEIERRSLQSELDGLMSRIGKPMTNAEIRRLIFLLVKLK